MIFDLNSIADNTVEIDSDENGGLRSLFEMKWPSIH